MITIIIIIIIIIINPLTILLNVLGFKIILKSENWLRVGFFLFGGILTLEDNDLLS
jgi:hypothetical protein